MKRENAIEIEKLGKEYHLRHEKGRSRFWALRDIDLSLPSGQVLGLIGANGAGKSTLLKILSRITYPTTGQVRFRGNLTSLLEVGTGFHPELSGRENIFLNGALLGMKRREIRQRLDEIVAFSGVEAFLDTPVKHYSSGMYVRLAFSVAANLDPDILLVDEVLAVGDAAFQQKCLQRMEAAQQEEGRTVIFVSHNMSSIRQLCQEVVWLEAGRIKQTGPADETVSAYLQQMQQRSDTVPLRERTDRLGSGEVRITELRWESPAGILTSGEEARLIIGYESKGPARPPALHFRLNVLKDNEEYLTTLSNEMNDVALQPEGKSGEVVCRFAALPFLAGRYHITANLWVGSVKADKIEQALSFRVEAGKNDQRGALKTTERAGIRVAPEWRQVP